MKPMIFSFIALLSLSSAIAAKADLKTLAKKSSEGLHFSPEKERHLLAHQNQLSILAVGDVLLHDGLHIQALKSPLGHKSLWKYVLPFIEKADMSYANLEGPVAPGVNDKGQFVTDPGMIFDQYVYDGYPRFNYHETLIQDLVSSGFDVVSTANNHALDHESNGVNKTIEMLNKDGLQFTGTKNDSDSRQELDVWPTIVERNGFRIAWLACTFSTNGIEDSEQQVLHCFKQKTLILSMIKELSANSNIDAVIITAHVGKEYEDLPEERTVTLYHAFTEAGALAVLGAHPHVLQPWEKHITADGREALIIYSLGNFVSGQFQRLKTRASMLLNMNLVKNHYGKASIAQVQYLPLEMRRNSKDGYTVMPISSQFGSQDIYKHILGMFGTTNLLSPLKSDHSSPITNNLQ